MIARFPITPIAGDPSHVRVTIRCSRCDAGGPQFVHHTDPDPCSTAWARARFTGYFEESTTKKIVCGPDCGAAVRVQADTLPFSLDASRNPHDPRLQRAEPTKDPLERTIAVVCAGERCHPIKARMEVIQRRTAADNSWSPPVATVMTATGWHPLVGGAWCCSAPCAAGEANRPEPIPVTPVLAVNDAAYQRARAAAHGATAHASPPRAFTLVDERPKLKSDATAKRTK